MFTFIFFLLLAGAGAVLLNGIKKKKPSRITAGIVLLLLVFGFFRFMDFWGEKLWFDSLGYTERFWILELAQYGFGFAGLVAGALLLRLLLFRFPAGRRWILYLSIFLGALTGMVWGYGNWPVFLLFINKVPTEITDPIFGLSTSFYFFSLPFYNTLLTLLLFLSVIAIIASLLAVFTEPDMWRQFSWNQRAFSGFVDPALYNPLFATTGIFLLLLACSSFLSRYELLMSGSGVVYGPGWTDVNVRLPMIWLMIVFCALTGLLLLFSPLRSRLRYWLAGRFPMAGANPGAFLLALLASLGVVWFLALGVVPGLFQNFKVKPTEITLEKPFILHNIRFTREAYDLNKIQSREYPVTDVFTEETVRENMGVFSNIRLWDYRALDEVYKQFQEFRLYYEFEDIDVDRYRYNGKYNQVMVSAREMDVDNLPQQSQTFVNRRFKYTHGYGIVMNNVSEFTRSGLPELLIRNIPPLSKYPELEVEEPAIYYGEETGEYVVANSKEEEFAFPQGDDNVYIHYKGKGGVQLQNYWRQFLFAYKFDETKLLFSEYPRAESRIMFHRNIKERAQRLAPFLHYDSDPYIVLAEGKLYWMIDAYTVSDRYPYSQPFSALEGMILQGRPTDEPVGNMVQPSLRGVNYIRNSVKVVVDAYDGSVDFYTFEPEDPLIQVWDKVLPGLLKPWEEMPESLLNHIRYPVDLLLVQGVVYAKYHMEDPTVFYNQEDLWVRATEKYHDGIQPVEPYYIMWELPEEDELSFVLMMPFTPKNRQVLIGWLAGMSDPEHYGELLAYNFPKDKRVLGPQQVETKIDQDATLSSQLSLWDQRGSSVIRGNVLAIPVNETLFYVEPIYLQSETAAYPELRLVVIMHNDDIAYAPTFEEALQKLLVSIGGRAPEGISEVYDAPFRGMEEEAGEAETPAVGGAAGTGLIREANQAFEDYLRYTGDRDYRRASEALRRLEESLKALQGERQGDSL